MIPPRTISAPLPTPLPLDPALPPLSSFLIPTHHPLHFHYCLVVTVVLWLLFVKFLGHDTYVLRQRLCYVILFYSFPYYLSIFLIHRFYYAPHESAR